MTFTVANGFAFSIDPILIHVGKINVYWYGFVYTLGFSALWLWLLFARRQLNWTAFEVSEACVIFIVAVTICGRLFDVVVYEWGWYSNHISQIPMIWKGGMATHGLLLGSIIGAVIISTVLETPLLKLLDIISVAAAFIFGVGRIGNFIEGGVIGTATDLPWGIKISDVEGFRHPVAIYDGIKNLLLVPVLIVVLRLWPAGTGTATGCFLVGYGGLRFIVDEFRDYESQLLGLGPGQWFNLAMAVSGLFVLVWRFSRMKAVPQSPSITRDFAKRHKGTSYFVTIALLATLTIFPACIPNSWTSEYLHLKRLVPRE
jgi:phosphatidylglycerol:prolipoprotein diacylglycerol transferase